MHQRRALHQGVVDVEEGGRGQIRRRRARGRRRSSSTRCATAVSALASPCQRLHGGFVSIANGHHVNPKTPVCADTGCREPGAGGVADPAGLLAVRADRGRLGRAGARARLRLHDHRRRRRGRQPAIPHCAPSSATGCRWCCSTAASTATGSSTSPGCGPISRSDSTSRETNSGIESCECGVLEVRFTRPEQIW